MRQPNPAKLERQVEQFNDAVPVGTRVTVRRDSGEIEETRTRSAAWVMGGHSAMVLLEGIAGGYLTDRVRRIQ